MSRVSWGTETIPGVTRVSTQLRPQQAPPVRTNPDATRGDRQGTRGLKIITLDGGLGVRHGSESSKDIQRLKSSQGLWSHIFGSLTLPPAATSNAAISATDISGFRAANRHVHSINTTIGQSKNRSYHFVGKKCYRPTSDSNPALVDSTLALTNLIIGVFEGKLNGVRYVILGTDGTTDDCQAVSDPTATPPTRTTAFAYSAGDSVWGGFFLPNLGPGFNIFHGKIGGVTGFHYLKTNEALLTAPKPVVEAATKDIEGSLATATTSAKSPTRGTTQVRSGSTTGTPQNTIWNTPGNILASDNAYAQSNPITDGDLTDYLIASGYDFSEIPLSARITGILVAPEVKELLATNDIPWASIRLLINGGLVGVDMADATELPTTDTTKNFGGSTDRWGTDLTGADVQRGLAVRMQFGQLGGDAGAGVDVDHVPVTLTWRPSGTIASIPLGSKVIGIDPQNQNVGYILAPEYQDDPDGVNVPRILWKLTFAYDVAGDRPVVTIEKVNTLLSHVEAGIFSMGGIVVAGDPQSGVSKQCRRIDNSGDVFDLFFSGGQGFTEPFGIISLHAADQLVVADCALEDATIAQAMVCNDGRWSALGPRETITALPLAIVGDSTDLNQRFRYRIRPATTNTATTRQFQPVNLLQDPLMHQTAIVKHDGVLTVDLPALDLFGAEEALKVLINAWCLSRDVSSTNTIRVRYSTDDGTTKTTWVTFTAFGSKSNLSPAVLERTTVLEIGLTHTASSTGTPGGLPLLFEGAALWGALRQWRVYFDPTDAAFRDKYHAGGGVEKLFTNLQTLQATVPIQTFKPGNGVSVPALWTGYRSLYQPTNDPAMNGDPITEPETFPQTGHWLEYDEVIS